MKIILLRNVENLGKEGEIKEVSSGYARNFLIPRQLADIATDELISRVEARKKHEEKKAKQHLLNTEKIADQLEGKILEIKCNATKEGTLYAALNKTKIAEILNGKGFSVKPKNILMENIKEIGDHEVAVTFNHGLEAKIIIQVLSEDKEEKKE